jgi:hypothetical protein
LPLRPRCRDPQWLKRLSMPKAAQRRSPDDHTPFPLTPCLARNFDRYRLLSRAAAAAAFTFRLTFPFPQPSFSPQLVPSHPPNHFPTRTKHRVFAEKTTTGVNVTPFLSKPLLYLPSSISVASLQSCFAISLDSPVVVTMSVSAAETKQKPPPYP